LKNELDEPIYVFRNTAIAHFYLKDKYRKLILFDFPERGSEDLIKRMRGTVLLVNFPPINPDGLIWQKMQTCTNLKTFKSNNQESGYVFLCK